MNPTCTDRELGQLLHPYEIGSLPDDDVDRFEAHMLACDHCAAQIEQFDRSAVRIRHDADLRSLTREMVAPATTGESTWSRLKAALWPQGGFWLKPAVAYLAIVLLAYPAYLGLRTGSGDMPSGATTILLTGTRAIGSVPKAVDEPVVLYFRVAGHSAGTSYDVILRTDAGAILYRESSYTAIDAREMGTLVFPPSDLEPGNYVLQVSVPDGRPVQEYRFELK